MNFPDLQSVVASVFNISRLIFFSLNYAFELCCEQVIAQIPANKINFEARKHDKSIIGGKYENY
jgi:hypothetical protein